MTVLEWSANGVETQGEVAPSEFDALFLAGYVRLVRSVSYICGDPEVAADCVADAFERAYVRWRKVGQLEDPLGWVRRVAIHRATDVHRRRLRNRRAIVKLGMRPQPLSRMAQQVSDSMQFHDSELAGAVAELSPQQRAVVVLHYLDDMSVIEVSAALSLSAGAVKYHLHQARERLRNILQPAPSAGSTESDDPYREGAP